MSTEQGLLPGFDFRYPLIQHQERWDTSQEKNGHKKDYESPRCNAKSWHIEGLEWHPSTEVHKAGGIKCQVNDRPEDIAFDVDFEVTIP
jgi:hypothetical protein